MNPWGCQQMTAQAVAPKLDRVTGSPTVDLEDILAEATARFDLGKSRAELDCELAWPALCEKLKGY